MKKLFLVIIPLLLLSCTQPDQAPTVTVVNIAQPKVVGLSEGYYTNNQSFTVEGGGSGSLQYSLDAGTTWNGYSGAVSLLTSNPGLYKVTARQMVNGNVSGNTPVINVYVDSTPPTVLTISSLKDGAYIVPQTIWIDKVTGQTVKYTLDGGSTWNTLASNLSFLTLSNDGDFKITVKVYTADGNVASSSTESNIQILQKFTPTFTPAPSTYTDNKSISITSLPTGLKIKIKMKDGSWRYWNSETFSATSDGLFLGDWSNGTPPQITDNGSAFSIIWEDTRGNASSELKQIYSISSSPLSPPTINGISAGYFNTDQTFSLTFIGKSAEYSTDGGAHWTAYSNPVTLSTEGSYSVIARSYDSFSKLIGTTSSIAVNILKTPPTAPYITGPSGYFCTAQAYTLVNIPTGCTGQYSLDGGSTWGDGNTFTVGGPTASIYSQSYSLVVRAKDQAGNVSVNSTPKAITITNTPNLFIAGITDGNYYNTDKTFSITSSVSGYTLQYNLNNTGWVNATGATVTQPASSNTDYSLNVRALDSNGIVVVTNTPIYFHIYKATPPTPKLMNNNVDITGKSYYLVSPSVPSALAFKTNNVSSSYSAWISIDNGVTWSNADNGITLPSTERVSYQVKTQLKDLAGNYSTPSSAITISVAEPLTASLTFTSGTTLTWVTATTGNVKYTSDTTKKVGAILHQTGYGYSFKGTIYCYESPISGIPLSVIDFVGSTVSATGDLYPTGRTITFSGFWKDDFGNTISTTPTYVFTVIP